MEEKKIKLRFKGDELKVVTEELKDRGISCKGRGFNCHNCKDSNRCVDYEEVNTKEYTTQEVIASIEDGQEYVCTGIGYNIKSIYREYGSIFFRYVQERPESGLGLSLSAKFTLVKKDKEVSFIEAMKAYGKCIYSITLEDGNEFKHYYKNCNRDSEIREVEDGFCISPREILEGKWFIKCQ